ncbi:TonB-dependent receptor domain-containing protein [Sphingomonas alpina]|uniref:TonB-dependent receptor n=1 Tax=Sphingomonas alpina TaxID=653931 RepID=A0A7H0LFA9_9SPHN|nr:TonB-dependent receptor [Sphingomonas alpina]QNQ08362.1 TonB-dependent receptor [Sphingomonas alpina]
MALHSSCLAPIPLMLAIAGLTPAPALAQRVQDNAVTDAEDAFGSNDGGEELGIYGPTDVRGFSPIDAGNVRLEGLYIDRQGDLSPRLVEGNRIRIGPSAIGYPFPSPSGIVDYRLRTPGARLAVSAVTQVHSFGGALIEVDAQVPLAGETLGLGIGVSQAHNEYASGNNADILSTALIGVWRPAPSITIKPFWSRVRIVDEDIFPIIIGNGVTPPPRMRRRQFVGQHWADVETERFNYGAIGQGRIGDFNVRAGAFRSVTRILESHSVLLDAAPPGTLAARRVVGAPPRANASTSGEIGVSRGFGSKTAQHELMLTVRARAQQRRYGGSDSVSIGAAPFDTPLYVPRPTFDFGRSSDDRVRQWTVGVGYLGRITGLGQVSLGLQRSDYRKAVTAPGGPLPVSRDTPWLFNLAATVDITPVIALYGGYTRGLEESDVAPETASNRDEAPPAIRTRQIDAGVRLRLGPMTLIAGGFDIAKPYYGLDSANLFRDLGTITHRGVELSLNGSPVRGLTIVGGGVLLDARVSGVEVASGVIGKRPIGTATHTLIGSLDWRPVRFDAFSIDLGVEHRGPSLGDAANLVKVRPYTTIDLGVRYRFRLGGRAALARLRATNLFNSDGWDVNGNNAFTYIQSRQLIARLAVDF